MSQDHAYALPLGYMLEEYRIEGMLGSGGFGMTYLAHDMHLDKRVAVKEYLPNDFAVRYAERTVGPKSSAEAGNYQWGLERFLEEAQVLAGFDHAHINRVHRRFQAHGTAYLVLEYISGETLSARLRRTKVLSPAEALRLFREMLSGLEVVHRQGYVHRDIKPGNIMLREEGSAVLLDFGAARQLVGQRSKSVTSLLTPGYAPVEQYDSKAVHVGPWSDFYALGVTAYCCVTGVSEGALLDAVARSRLAFRGELEQDMRPAEELARGGYDRRLLRAIDGCMKVDERERPQSVGALQGVLDGAPEPKPVPPNPPPQPDPRGKPLPPAVWAVAGAVLLLVGLGLWQWLSPLLFEDWRDDPGEALAPAAVEPVPATPPRVAEEPGSLVLELSPSDARVILPDIELGYRSGMALPAGAYQVIVRKPGYEEFVGTVRIVAGERTRRSIVLRRARGAGRAVGAVFRDVLEGGGEGPEMVVLPTGSFRMGDLSGDGDSDESPVRTVTIGKRIAMGRYEVTFADYDRFADADSRRSRPDDEGWGRGRRPVINVSQEDAKAYAVWLSAQTGKTYRLPSESEWEYAARAGTTTRYSWGDEIGDNRANCDGCGSEWDDEQTAPVGRFEPNAFGLYDMHGNVWEWVEDCYVDTYTGAPIDGSARTSGCVSDSAVLRGGAWSVSPRPLRAADRVWGAPSDRDDVIGFRLVQDLNP